MQQKSGASWFSLEVHLHLQTIALSVGQCSLTSQNALWKCVLFHFVIKPEVPKFSREMKLDSRVAKEAVLVCVQFSGGFLLLWFFFNFQNYFCHAKRNMSAQKVCISR